MPSNVLVLNQNYEPLNVCNATRAFNLIDRGKAEILEHVLSEELEELIAAKLGHPTHDPHGDPIPSADLEIEERPTQALSSLTPGSSGVFVRVSDSDPGMLRYLAELGITPGDRFEITDRQPFGGPVFARFTGRVHPLGGELAAAMRVEPDRPVTRPV